MWPEPDDYASELPNRVARMSRVCHVHSVFVQGQRSGSLTECQAGRLRCQRGHRRSALPLCSISQPPMMVVAQVLRTVKGERPGAGAGLQEAGVTGSRDSLNLCILREAASHTRHTSNMCWMRE